MKYLSDYVKAISDMPAKLIENEKEKIEAAASLMADAVEAGKLIHIFGTDAHASMAGEELFWQEGGLMNINPIFDPGFSLAHGAYRCWMIEQLPDYAAAILDYYKLDENDVIIIANAYGVNRISIDAAKESKKRGLAVIAITSKELADSVPLQHPARYPGKENLYDLEEVDIVIDGHILTENNKIRIPETKQKMGPLATIFYSVTLGILNAAAVKKLYERGLKPDVLKSMYNCAGIKHNEKMIEKYYSRIKHI